jgi:plastocyanin
MPARTLLLLRSRRTTLVLVAGALLVTASGAQAAPPVPSVALAGPQAPTVGFATPSVLTVTGQALTLANGDTTGHDITSKLTKPKKLKFGKKYYTIQVPLFRSESVPAGSTGPVVGVEGLKPGTYAFFCSLHTSMTGSLIVQAAG